jgi:hypothetical protein
LESEDSLWSAALKWVRANAPEGVVLVDSWEDHLWEELAGSGLLVAHGKELRFLHQSFAEFLSAQACAEAIGDQFAELAIWIRRGLQKAEQTLVLFTFAMWGAHPGNDISIVLDHLLNSHDPQRVLLAGRLLAEGVAAPDAAAARVVNRLIAQARNIDDWDAHVEAFAALGALFDRAEVVERL